MRVNSIPSSTQLTLGRDKVSHLHVQLPVLQVYDRHKRLKRSMHLLEPIFAASFLNDKGDIIAALNRNLVVIRADNYQFLTADEMASLVTEHARSQLAPGQACSQAGIMAQRAAEQLARSGSKVHQALVRQATLGQLVRVT